MIRVLSFQEVKNPWRDEYLKRIRDIVPFEWKQIPLRRSPSERPPELLPEEKKFLETYNQFWLLDVEGKEMTSKELTRWLFKEDRNLVVGPAVGFHPLFVEKARGRISLSKLTFTHSLAQTMLAESLYRSVCELKNHPFVK